MRLTLATITAPLLFAIATPGNADAQEIDPSQPFSWNENTGFMNWAPGEGRGVIFVDDHLEGHIWCENIGWINLGDGPLFGGVQYANTAGENSGVNVLPDGRLSGYAWGENVGWIFMDGGDVVPPGEPARVDVDAGRLFGYAWGENIGWINLDDALVFVGVIPAPPPACPCDWNVSGMVDVLDLLAFLGGWFPLNGSVVFQDPIDFDGSGVVTVVDLLSFLECWFAASAGAPCP